VDAGSVDAFRGAWVLGAVLSLATAVVGVRLARPRRAAVAPAVAPAPAGTS
jgi:hypothetical protein